MLLRPLYALLWFVVAAMGLMFVAAIALGLRWGARLNREPGQRLLGQKRPLAEPPLAGPARLFLCSSDR